MIDLDKLRAVRISLKEVESQINFDIVNSNLTLFSAKKIEDSTTTNIDFIEFSNDKGILRIQGWIIDHRYRLCPKCIFITKGSTLIKIHNTFTPRSDVSNYLQTYTDNFGFEIKVKCPEDEINIYALLPDDTVSKIII